MEQTDGQTDGRGAADYVDRGTVEGRATMSRMTLITSRSIQQRRRPIHRLPAAIAVLKCY